MVEPEGGAEFGVCAILSILGDPSLEVANDSVFEPKLGVPVHVRLNRAVWGEALQQRLLLHVGESADQITKRDSWLSIDGLREDTADKCVVTEADVAGHLLGGKVSAPKQFLLQNTLKLSQLLRVPDRK